MKRKFTAMLAAALVLTLLAACGTDEPAATPASATPVAEPSATPEATPEASPEIQSVPVDFHLPDAGFEPDSYWLADGFGDNGQAIMLSSTDEEGNTSFKCWYSVYDEHRSGGRTERDLFTGCFTSDEFYGGGFEQDNTGLMSDVSIDGDSLTVSTNVPEGYVPLPETFRRVSLNDALAAYRKLPYTGESLPPIDLVMKRTELEALPGIEQTGENTYEYKGMELGIGYETYDGTVSIGSIASGNPDSIPDIRGIKIGSSAEDVLACFPGSVTELERPDGGQTMLYGTDGIVSSTGVIAYDGDTPCIVLSDMLTSVQFRFDENGLVEYIVWMQIP